MIKENIKIIRDFFRLVKGNKFWITLLFLGSILGHLSSLLTPIFTSNIIYEVTNGNANGTYLNIIMLAITYIVYNLFWFLNYTAYSYNFKYSYKKLREKIIDKVFTYDSDFSDKISKGEILNTINTDTASLSEMIDSICEIMVVFVKVIVMIIIFLTTNLYIGIFVLLLEILYLKAFDYCNIKSTKYLRGQQKYRDKLTDNMSQILNGLSEIKVFNIYDKIKSNFYIIANKWSDQYMYKRKYVNIRASLLPFIVHFGKVSLYAILVYLVLNGNFKVNTLILLITYFENIMNNTNDLMDYSRKIREWSISIFRINNILNYTSKQQMIFGNNENDYIDGLIEFKNVNFSYKTKNRGNIENINLTIDELLRNNPYYIDLQTNNYSSSHKKLDDNISIEKHNIEEK